MDNKPLLQDRPPAYSPAAPTVYEYGPIPPNYGTIRNQFSPPYPYHTGEGYISSPVSAYPSVSSIVAQPTTAAAATPVASAAAAITSVVVVGGCPACRVGVLEDSFTCLGIFCAIFFFPIGILFCLALRQRRCPNCGATFG
ncbi:hypothetical protein GDO81_016844 [Engystomops pustulosus]|uniref:Membrane protein BRI3 n=1 Tax=Engystomops pustulosus TaxID=76066 RepID=A0AAV7A9W3_ENGPU|nr:hypothetical protein GDO81_016844 [Engystomops pustulosus]KAG8558067.1 hypothetical protein GDO81_016844 [Engystomops pustulosus]